MAQTGTVELQTSGFGGDFLIAANGDLELVVDTMDAADATRARLERMLLTSPRLSDVDGVMIGRPDDLFNPDWGAGLPAAVGAPNSAALVNGIQARITQALASDPDVAMTPAPQVSVVAIAPDTVQVSVQCETVIGQSVAIPPFPLKVTGG